MKSGLMIILLLVSQLSFAQSRKDIKTKEEILQRVDTLIKQLNEAEELLNRQDPEPACDSLESIFAILPEHLMAIGTKMSFFDGNVVRMEHETKMFLIYIHQQVNIANSGERGENINMSKVSKQLKAMRKALEKQKKKIKKLDTSYSNQYSYRYEFN